MVTLRGIRSRLGRSLLVVLLSTIAIAAAVLVPLYSTAAAQSVLTDTVAAAPPIVAGLHARSGTRSGLLAEDVRKAVDAQLTTTPAVAAVLGAPQYSTADVINLVGKAKNRGKLVFRPGACEHVTITSGRCPGAGEVMVSDRAAGSLGVRIDEVLALRANGGLTRAVAGQPTPVDPTFTVVGVYRIGDPTDPYWETTGFFPGSLNNVLEDGTRIIDELFTGSEDRVVTVPRGLPVATVDYPLVAGKVRLAAVPELTRESQTLSETHAIDQVALLVGLLPSLRVAADQRAAVNAAVPTVALPLVVLCWFVLFLVIAAVTDDRRAEIAVGKLRGLSVGGITRFAIGEPLLLITVAAPFGVLLGIGLTKLAADTFLAPGVDVRVGWPAYAVGLGALLGAAVAAVLGARQTVRATIVTLLRRVPHRSGRRTAVIEAIVAALAVAALYQLLFGGRGQKATLGYAAPALVALLAGLLTARLLGLVARRRLVTATRRGRLPAMLAAAQVGRRPESARLVAVLTVALALLTFAATIWDVSSANRTRTADADLGADRVYVVSAEEPRAVPAAVERIDPTGKQLMAVVRSRQSYAGDYVELVGVQLDRMAAVSRFPDKTPAQVAALAIDLGDQGAPPVPLHTGRLEVRATVTKLNQSADRPMGLGIVVGEPDAAPRAIPLGLLKTGPAAYAGELSCVAECRLLGLQVRRLGADNTPGAVTLTVDRIELDGQPLDASLSSADAWRPVGNPPVGQTLTTTAGDAGLTLDVTSESSSDVLAQYGDVVKDAPVALAGPSPADDRNAAEFSFPVFGKLPDDVRVVDRVPLLPRVGNRALLFDGAALVSRAERSAGLLGDQLSYEVWATSAAPADLGARLAAEGIPATLIENRSTRVTQLGRAAPALALRLYLFAGLVALLLALGALVLDAGVTAPWRREQIRALRITGVAAGVLRRAANRENVLVLGFPVVAGIVAGVGGAAVVLPAIALVNIDGSDQAYRLGGWWLPGSLLFLMLALAIAAVVLRRIRGGAR
ncbi:FtsX-like permease family protein [Asanoa ferruginea]|uniref:FtsX-like permease family protein n=1 Tax=Asanoa ferruginea TaxID=53367 RepID=A0A3D9ZJP0_9ACTN|nr:FtsX-like permease family protein [Asanoa ferruginea]REF97646.1 FtsX-like permease family protein [Asanoa ferruginea]